jgi:hypothetical protein
VEHIAGAVEEGLAVVCTWMSAASISMLQFVKYTDWFELTMTTTTVTVTKHVKNIVPPAPSKMPVAKPGWAAIPPENPRIKSSIFEGGNNIVNLMMGIWKRKRNGVKGNYLRGRQHHTRSVGPRGDGMTAASSRAGVAVQGGLGLCG